MFWITAPELLRTRVALEPVGLERSPGRIPVETVQVKLFVPGDTGTWVLFVALELVVEF